MKKFAVISFVAALLLSSCVHAASPAIPKLEKTNGYTLTVNFVQDKDNGESKKIKGGEFTVYKIADLTASSGGVYYTCIDPYKEIAKYNDSGEEITFDGIDSDVSHEYAIECAKKKGTPVASAVSSDSGACSFEIEDPGMYLVTETKKTDEAAKYETADPFLVSVPALSIDQDSVMRWVYDVNAYPKTAVKQLPVQKKPQETASSQTLSTIPVHKKTEEENHISLRTGDADHSLVYMIIGGACLLTIFIAKRKKNGN